MYPSIEERAANLLYFLIKDHSFVDGCKRMGASIFLEFLNKNKHLIIDRKQIISDSALVAITLMIAESRPEEKETMVKLVMNFLKCEFCVNYIECCGLKEDCSILTKSFKFSRMIIS